MATNPTVDRTETIARLNDRARLGLDPTARITFTRTCLAAFCDPDTIEVVVIQAQLLAAFRNCMFAEDSPERDLGTIEFRGRKVWLKVDYYDSELCYGSDDPADASVTTRVLTILLPEDY
ncbi:DUF3768 domain-containing protein [Novosphingobium sp. Fuku2-ISO-50]|uniref:DUF3768 domain-containing protein n=1 Tax=Novosphingobium sp. Fuku2-ISO-50 TaxID=1739114 RepID=UPI00076D0920|nr:DUF3768 domain-containing protein [Novosphingobium sp. Fuku2-ISO-50]KUR75288.1 hypothetical protein AQZ50_15610 [Novosphingobium sp. Fuku2-ISO-50]